MNQKTVLCLSLYQKISFPNNQVQETEISPSSKNDVLIKEQIKTNPYREAKNMS